MRQRDNRLRVVRPDDREERFTYDRFSQVQEYTNARGYPTTHAYDVATGNLLQTRNALDQLTDYHYTSRGCLDRVTDRRSQVTTFVADTFAGGPGTRDLVQETVLPDDDTDPLNNPRVVYDYHAATGRLVRMTDPLGRITTYAEDALNRRVRETEAANVYVAGQASVSGAGVQVTSPPLGSASWAGRAVAFLYGPDDVRVRGTGRW